MHTTTFSMHIAVVDQVQFAGAGTPRSVVLDADALDRAAALGRNVAGQLGVAFDEARYLGPPGLCPMCHLDVVALHGADVECATCGARGLLGPGHEVTWTDLSTSVISMDEKQAHAVEIQETAERHRELRPEIEERARAYEAYDRTVRPDRTPASGLPVRRHYLDLEPRLTSYTWRPDQATCSGSSTSPAAGPRPLPGERTMGSGRRVRCQSYGGIGLLSSWRMRATRSPSHLIPGSGSRNAVATLPAPRAGSDHSRAVAAPNGLALTRDVAIPGTGWAMMMSPRSVASTSVISVSKVAPVSGRIR
ncbi:MAG: hypothetical protein ABSB59_39150 [Streptosporangiaceae bacterium]